VPLIKRDDKTTKQKSLRILNIGCGSDTYGTDFVDLYPTRPEVIKYDIEKQRLPYKSNTFNKIVALGILQSITNLSNFFKECRRTLKKGGTIEILAANAGFWGPFGSSFYGKYDRISAEDGRDDDKAYLLFTITTLRNLLVKYGFRNVKCSYELASRNKKNNSYHLILIRLATLFTPRFYPHIKATATK